MTKNKIFSSAAALAEHLQNKRPATLVSTNGCFDLLHPGHVEYLETSRALGDALVVLVNTDASVKAQNKGEGRPLNTEVDRMRVLAGLESVTYVCPFGEDTPEAALALLKPEIHTKGGDYKEADLPEAKLLKTWDGKIKLVDFVPGKSTTKIIAKISKGSS